MAEPVTIAKIPADQDTDFEALYNEGVALLQQFSGDIWTDYNEHDPGITILESLCYVLTDLYDRTEIPIQNLLTQKNGKMALEENALYSASDILLNEATTLNDYSKIIIDGVKEVNNAWVIPYYYINPFNNRRIGIAGMYEVIIDLVERTPTNIFESKNFDDTTTQIKEQVSDLLHSKKKIAEVFPKITILAQKMVWISFNASLKETSDIESILAEVLYRISTYIKPCVDFYTYDELAAKGLATEEIFAGPRLQNGFIPDSELSPKMDAIYADSILKLIIQTKEITSIENINIAGEKATYTIPKEDSLALDLMASLDKIKVYKKGVHVTYDKNLVVSLFNELQSKEKKNRRFKFSSGNLTIEDPVGEYVDPSFYYSLQNEFPSIYGIGKEKLPAKADNIRRSQALQLKAYLLFFEQIFADFMAQTASLKSIFSTKKQERTYFYQPLYSIPDAPPLLKGFKGNAADIYENQNTHSYSTHCEEFVANKNNPYLTGLDVAYKEQDDFLSRRNTFLDHLLARFNFEVNVLPVLSHTPDNPDNNEIAGSIKIKESILQNITSITASRGNFQVPDGTKKNGFDPALGILLHTLSGIKYGDPVNNSATKCTILKPVSYSTNNVLFELTEDNKIAFNVTHHDFLAITIAGLFLENYFTERKDDVSYFYLLVSEKKLKIAELKNVTEHEIIGHLADDFLTIYLEHENIHVIEHISLMPSIKEPKFIWKNNPAYQAGVPAGTDYPSVLGQLESAFQSAFIKQPTVQLPDPVIGISIDNKIISQDFYSSRLTIIIPDTAIDLTKNATYQNYFNSLIINNLPAHIYPQLLCLNRDDYETFVKSYKVYVKNPGSESNKKELTRFLFSQKNFSAFLIH
ncbi:MAG TPA: hypothetical protein VGF30_01970 [Bacteroidia bacterium]